jgi:beta-mannanase
MELTGAHPWALGDPQSYVAAYRRHRDVYAALGVTNAVFVWSPAGNSGAGQYYPGSLYVDVVGITVLGAEEWDRGWGFDSPRSFSTLLDEKYILAAGYGKPLVVAELGVATGDWSRSALWLRDAKDAMARYPLLRGFAYYNSDQPTATPRLVVFPDWRLADPSALYAPSD